ncbi:MAG: hypothetical protein QME12_04215 [Nanoarchaeota archaeon]|nr:hypothetical protein [Nanoarchaeota archaeon]
MKKAVITTLAALVTQIGSLPYDSAEKAVAYSLRHDIPFLPELPMLGDSMIQYIQNPGKMSCLEKFKKHSYDIAKVQCIGPATLMFTGKYSEEEAVLQIYTHIDAILKGLNARETILFLDEPALGQSGIGYESKWNGIFSCFNVTKGIHVCGLADFERLFKADIDILSFDASQYDLSIYDREKYMNFRQKGGRIAWGIETAPDIEDFRKGDLITMPCGLGGMNRATGKPYTEEECESALEMLIKAKEKYII